MAASLVSYATYGPLRVGIEFMGVKGSGVEERKLIRSESEYSGGE